MTRRNRIVPLLPVVLRLARRACRALPYCVAALAFWGASPAGAAPLYSTSFEGTVGSLPADWRVLAGTTGQPGWRMDPFGEYRYDGTGNALSDFTGVFTSGQSGSAFADGTVEAHFRKSSGAYTGLGARIQDASNLYHARLIGNSLEIYRFGGTGGTASLGSVPAAGYDSGETWRISMTLVGTTISASVFDQAGTQVASLTVRDSSFASGTVGVRGGNTSAWEDFVVTAPPELNVDIGLAGSGNQVQAGFQSFAQTNDADPYSTSPKAQWLDSQLGNANRVRVEVAAAGGRLGFRDRSDVTHALGDLAEDFVFSADGPRLSLSLGSLKPGVYSLTTYHHDAQSYIAGTLDLSVDDARGTGQPRATGLAISGGTSPTSVASAAFSFFSDGVHPVVVHVDRNTANLALLNGFQLAPAADSLRVDFGLSGAANDVQDGFAGFSRATAATTGQQTEVYSSSLGRDGTVTVRVAGTNNQLDWRDRGDSGAAQLADVAEDFVFGRDWIELTLEGLAPSQYLVTTYHHDLTHVASPLQIAVWDPLGSAWTTVATVTQTVSASGNPSLATFSIIAGSGPVTIRFNDLGTGTDPIARLNGFSLTAVVPEPSALALLGIGSCGVLAWARPRRRAPARRAPGSA